jgi:hypothetical protein
MRRILPCLAAGLGALVAGCNPQTSNPFALFGQPTIPPPGTIAGAGGNDYYPAGQVTLPASAAASSPTTRATAGSTAGAIGDTSSPTAAGVSVGTAALPAFQPARASEAAIRIVENPNPTLRTAAITPRGGTIEAVPAAAPGARSAAGGGDGLLEITRLPGNRGLLAPLPITPALNRTRGFLPAFPQQKAAPSNVLPAIPAQPRFSTGAPNAHYDTAVAPATWHQR